MTLDELLLEWSYRSEKGYPSLDNPSDISLLKEILEELDLPTDDIIDNLETPGTDGMEDSSVEKEKENQFSLKSSSSTTFATLTPKQIEGTASFGDFTGEKRIDILIRKIQNGEELTLIDGSTFIVDNKDEAIEFLKGPNIKLTVFRNKEGVEMSPFNPSKLAKTIEFGGKPAGSITIDSSVDTDIKENLVILMYNILKEIDDRNLDPFTAESYTNNFKSINNSTTKYQNIEVKSKNKIKNYFNLVGDLETPPNKVLKVLNNPYSIAKSIIKTYPNASFTRGDVFDDIRTVCTIITQLPPDKWNPGDIYLINPTQTLPDLGLLETDSIVHWNKLFVNNWGDTDAPLVSISLKEEKYQPGRAKSYLDKFGGKEIFNMGGEELKYTNKQLKDGIKNYRKKIKDIIKKKGHKYDTTGDGWKSFPSTDKRLREKYGAYKLLNYLLSSDNEATLLGLFTYGLSIDQDLRANPTFFKLIGKDNGGESTMVKYPAGVNADVAEDENIVIDDLTTNGNIKISGVILKTDGDHFIEKEDVSKTLRGSGTGQVQIL